MIFPVMDSMIVVIFAILSNIVDLLIYIHFICAATMSSNAIFLVISNLLHYILQQWAIFPHGHWIKVIQWNFYRRFDNLLIFICFWNLCSFVILMCTQRLSCMQYKFFVDGEWRHDEQQTCISGEYGVVNTVLLATEPSYAAPLANPEMTPGSSMDVDNEAFRRLVRIIIHFAPFIVFCYAID